MSREKQIIEEMAKIISEKQNGGWKFVGDSEYTTDVSNEELAEFLYNAGYSKQEWISVDERLPKELTHVIVCDEDGTVGEAFCYKEGRFEWMDSEELAFVTHWMPLPPPPKENKND